MKSSRRHNLRKKIRRSEAEADLVAADVVHPGPQELDEIFGLFWQTYEHSSVRFERLNRRFFEQLAALPLAHFLTLRLRATGELAAFMLFFDLGQRVINKFIGLDYARPKGWMLYFRLWDAALDWAVARRATSIQSGQTGYAAKIEIGHRLEPLTNYCRHSNWLVHRIYAAVARSVSWTTLDAGLAMHCKAHPRA